MAPQESGCGRRSGVMASHWDQPGSEIFDAMTELAAGQMAVTDLLGLGWSLGDSNP